MVSTLQKATSGENFIDRYPAKVRSGRRFEEVIKFYEECRQEMNKEYGTDSANENSCDSCFTTKEVKLLKEVAAAVAHLRSQ